MSKSISSYYKNTLSAIIPVLQDLGMDSGAIELFLTAIDPLVQDHITNCYLQVFTDEEMQVVITQCKKSNLDEFDTAMILANLYKQKIGSPITNAIEEFLQEMAEEIKELQQEIFACISKDDVEQTQIQLSKLLQRVTHG